MFISAAHVPRSLPAVRKFEPADFYSVLSIHHDNFVEFADPWIYMKAYEICSDMFFVATIENELFGFVVGIPVDKHSGRILSIAVSSGHRRKRIGSALMLKILESFKRANLKFATLEVRTSNEAAQRFYEKFGFEKAGIIEDYYEDGESAFIMELEI